MNDLQFSAKVDDADITGINELLGVSRDIDIDCGNPTVYIKYELEIEAREWGIKNICVSPREVTVSIEWEVSTYDLTDADKELLIKAGGTEYRNKTIGGIVEIDSRLALNGKAWTIDNETTFEDDGAFAIDNVCIDLETCSITLQ